MGHGIMPRLEQPYTQAGSIPVNGYYLYLILIKYSSKYT